MNRYDENGKLIEDFNELQADEEVTLQDGGEEEEEEEEEGKKKNTVKFDKPRALRGVKKQEKVQKPTSGEEPEPQRGGWTVFGDGGHEGGTTE